MAVGVESLLSLLDFLLLVDVVFFPAAGGLETLDFLFPCSVVALAVVVAVAASLLVLQAVV